MKAWLKQQAKEWIGAFRRVAGAGALVFLISYAFAYGATRGYQAAVEGVTVVDGDKELYYYVPLTGVVKADDQGAEE